MTEKRVIRFDWAIKTILRDKENFDVLEGLLTALLKEEIRVISILESEANAEEATQKFNRVDILVQDSKDRRLIIEIQNEHEADYLERLLFGTSKVIVENLKLGEAYKEIKKVISISILYFNLGIGNDYVYYGNTEFRGIHTNDLLQVREKVKVKDPLEDKQKSQLQPKLNIFPEYYLIRVESFPDLIAEGLDEWIYMLKHESVRSEFSSKNIQKAGEKLDFLKMNPKNKKQYERYLMNLVSERDIINTAKEEGREEGRDEGIDQGELIGQIRLFQKLSNQELIPKEELKLKSITDLQQLYDDLERSFVKPRS